MSDDLFRARVEPHRALTATDIRPGEEDEAADAVLEGLLASFKLGGQDFDERVRYGGSDFWADVGDPQVPPVKDSEAGTIPVVFPSRRIAAAHRRSRKPWLIAGAVLVVTGGVGATLATMGGSPSPTRAALLGQSVTASTAAPPTRGSIGDPASAPTAAAQAADWIAANVGPGHVVACDVTICNLLLGRGFPGASVITVQSDLTQVEQADVVAVTDVMRRQLGASLTSVIAGEPLAVLADGSSTVQITPVTIGGPSAYAGRLAADRVAAKAAGAALLGNPDIVLSDAAKTPLSSGLVDGRVCALLVVLGGTHKITVASFTGPGPGAGPDIPFAGVVISTIDGADAAGTSPQTAALDRIVSAQQPPYAPLSRIRIASGANQGLTILFSQPGPIGLLNSTTS